MKLDITHFLLGIPYADAFRYETEIKLWRHLLGDFLSMLGDTSTILASDKIHTVPHELILHMLPTMAAWLRAHGWCVYYWRDRHGIEYTGSTNEFINYGKRQGLIFGRYCPNLTAWMLANT